MANIFQEQITAEKPKSLAEQRVYVYVPRATSSTPGIASFDSKYFALNAGHVDMKVTDPTVLPSLVKIRNGDDGLIYEDGYVKTYLKTLNGISLIGDTDIELVTINSGSLIGNSDLKLVTLNTPQIIEAYKTFQVEYNNEEAFIVTTNTPGDKAFIAYPDKIVLTNGANYTHYKANAIVNNDYTLTIPDKNGTIAIQSEVDAIDTRLSTVESLYIPKEYTNSHVSNSQTYDDTFNIDYNMYSVPSIKLEYKSQLRNSDYYLFSQGVFQDNRIILRTGTNTSAGGLLIQRSQILFQVGSNDTLAVSQSAFKYKGNTVETQNNRVTTINDESTDTQYATAKSIYNFVNSSINNVAAYYITYNADGDAFPTHAALESAVVFYNGGQVRVPTRNDYCIVRADEDNDGATTRYSYQNNQWEFQYIVNESPMTVAQLAAINSGITSEYVAKIGSATLTTTATNLSDAINELVSTKQATISAGTGITLSAGTVNVDTNVIQTKLTFDNTPTTGSTNPVTSGGVKSALPTYLTFTNVSVSSSAFSVDTTYGDFMYKAAITLSGVTADMTPTIVFSGNDAISGNYLPLCESYNGGVYIWSKVNTGVTISTIILQKAGA